MTRRRRWSCRAHLLVALAALALPAGASANPITVETTVDLLSPEGNCSLREAVDAANNNNAGPSGDCAPGGGASDVITLPPSSVDYELANVGSDDDNTDGDLDITGDVTIRGSSATQAVIDGNGVDRVFDIRGTTVRLEDLSVTGGVARDGANGNPGGDQSGTPGADSIGGDGTEGEEGGGIRNAGNLTLDGVTVALNFAGDGGNGGSGGIAGNGAANSPGGDSTGGPAGVGGSGGGISSEVASSLDIRDSVITQNFAGSGGEGGSAGAAGTGGDTAGSGGNSTGGNGAKGGAGGGIAAGQQSTFEITGSKVDGNEAGAGGAGGNGGQAGTGGGGGANGAAGGDSSGGNGGDGGPGGGIRSVLNDLVIGRSSVTGNAGGFPGVGGRGGGGGDGGNGSAPGAPGDSDGGDGGSGDSGGGISMAGGSINIDQTLIAENFAADGGNGGGGDEGGEGIGASNSTGGDGGNAGFAGGARISADADSTLTSVTVADNRAGSGGDGGAGGAGNTSIGGNGTDGGSSAGLEVFGTGATAITFANVTVAGNAAGAGGSGGDAGTGSTATAGGAGTAGQVGGVDATGGTVVFRNGIIASNTSRGGANCQGTFDAASANNIFFPTAGTCPSGTTTDPLLKPLGAYGGPTETMALSALSPAIGAGALGVCSPTDQRGVIRPKGGSCDLGAVEYSPPGATTGFASAITSAAATLAGSLVTGDLAVTHRFDFGKTTAYGSQTPAVAGAGGIPANLSGLEPSTTYHYRLRVSNPDGTALGADRTFTTATAPPGGGGGGGGSTAVVGAALGAKSAKLDRKGRVGVKVRCPSKATEPCKGTLTLSAKVKKRKAKASATLKLGKAKFNIARGKAKTVRVKINKKGRRQIKRKGKLKATATFTFSGGKPKKAKLTLRR